MNKKLIKISDDHYILVDDSELKIGMWIYVAVPQLNVNKKIWSASSDTLALKSFDPNAKIYKITHSTKPIEKVHTSSGVVPPIPVYNKIDHISLQQCRKIDLNLEYDLNEIIEENCDSYDMTKREGVEIGFNEALHVLSNKKFDKSDLLSFQSFVSKWFDNKNATIEDLSQTIPQLLNKWLDLKQIEWDVEIIDNILKLK